MPAGAACSAVCIAACEAATACFDGNAMLNVIDGEGNMIPTKISDLADADKDVSSPNARIQSVEIEDENGSPQLKASTETLNAVYAVEGDFTFIEVTVKDAAGNKFALNTTDDHGWVVVNEGSDGCVTPASEIASGDMVLLVPQKNGAALGKVVSTRSFGADRKHMVHTDSGLVYANQLLVTVFCKQERKKYERRIPLMDRLAIWKREEAEKVRVLEQKFDEVERRRAAAIAKDLVQIERRRGVGLAVCAAGCVVACTASTIGYAICEA